MYYVSLKKKNSKNLKHFQITNILFFENYSKNNDK